MTDKALSELHKTTVLTNISINKRNMNVPLDITAQVNELSYNVNIEDHIILNENKVVKDIFIKLVDNFENTLAELDVIFTFKVVALKTKIKQDTKRKYLIPDLLDEWLNNIVIATSRGILYSEFRGTFVDNAILPFIDPDDLKLTN